jgi:hypothetical protein
LHDLPAAGAEADIGALGDGISRTQGVIVVDGRRLQ